MAILPELTTVDPTPTPDLTAGQRQFLNGLDPDQRSRFDELGAGKRAEVLAGFQHGPDRIAEIEARRALSGRIPMPPPSPPTSIREMIERLPGGDPALISTLAEAFCNDFGSRKDRLLWPALRSLAEQLWRREVSAKDVLEAYGQAMGPKAKVRGAVFTKALRNLGWRP